MEEGGHLLKVDVQMSSSVKGIGELELFVDDPQPDAASLVSREKSQVLRVSVGGGAIVAIPLQCRVNAARMTAKFLKKFNALTVSCPREPDVSQPTSASVPGASPFSSPPPHRSTVPPMALSLDDGDEYGNVDDNEQCHVTEDKGNRALDTDGPSAILKEQGNALVKAGDYAGALTAYSAAMVLGQAGSSKAALFTNRALCKMKMGDLEGALADCNACLALDPNFVRGYERRGDALVSLGRVDEAKKAFVKGLEIEPDHKGCTASLGALNRKAASSRQPAPKWPHNSKPAALQPAAKAKERVSLEDPVEKLMGEALGPSALIRLETRAGRGRCVVAKRSIRRGERVMIAEPMACVVHDKYLDEVCHACFKRVKEGEIWRCKGGCGGVLYCSKACETAARQGHEGECDVLKAWRLQATASGGGKRQTRGLRMFMRLACAYSRDANAARLAGELECGPGGEAGAEQTFGQHADAVNRFVRDGAKMERRRLSGVIARCQRNMHGIVNFEGQHFGTGLYPVASFFNHSCKPNCIVSFTGPTLCVHSIEEVGAGQELTIAYIELYAPRAWRRQQLLEGKGFECGCDRCLNDAGEAELIEGEEGVSLRAREGWDEALVLFQEGKFNQSRIVLETVVRMSQGGAIGDRNWVLFDTHKLLVDVCVALGYKEALEKHARHALACIRSHLPRAHPTAALMMQHLATALTSKGRNEDLAEAMELYEEAHQVLCVCYGREHEASTGAGEKASLAKVLLSRS